MGIKRNIFGTLTKLDVSRKRCQTEDLVKKGKSAKEGREVGKGCLKITYKYSQLYES